MGLFFGQNRGVVVPVYTAIKYGYLYNYYAISNALFAPAGYHIPTYAEFVTLQSYLGGQSVAGGKMRNTSSTYWDNAYNGSNTSGFNAKGSGYRDPSSGGCYNKLQQTDFWCISASGTYGGVAWISFTGTGLYLNETRNKKYGDCVRPIKDDSNDNGYFTDIDGNTYPTVKIGNQVWAAENYKCTKLRDGTPIPKVTDNTAWTALVTGAYCAYNNDENNV